MKRAALLGLALLCACQHKAPANTPAGASERFVDYEFVEIDQEKALPYTDGPARQALESELQEVRRVRSQGYTPEMARGKVWASRIYLKEDAEAGTARAIYDLTIDSGRDKDRRHVLVSLRRLDGHWKVTAFAMQEGAAPAAPPAPE